MAARRALFTQHLQRAFAAEVIEYSTVRGLNTFEFEMLSSTQWVFCVGTFRLYRAQSFVQSPFLEY